MNCAKARFLLYAYLDRELPKRDSEALTRHLANCPPCSARACSARGLVQLLRSRLDYRCAPVALRERLDAGPSLPRLRSRALPLGLAASILLLILPLVADQRSPRDAAMSLAGSVAVVAPNRAVPVAKKMTGTFVCLQCEAGSHPSGVCPLDERIHELGFCADNGETWRMMTADPAFETASVGQTVTVEGVAFPDSGFLRASRVGY